MCFCFCTRSFAQKTNDARVQTQPFAALTFPTFQHKTTSFHYCWFPPCFQVGRGNWGEINKEVVRRERFDKEFASTIGDAASAALGPNARKKRFGNGASSRSNPKRQRTQNNEMDTETFLAMWDREREQQQQSATPTRKKQTQQIEQLSPSGMAFHLQQGYQLQFAMGGSVLADSFSGVSPYERHDAVNVFNIGNVADKFFEPRPPPSARPRPPPNTANHRRGGGTAGPHNLSPRQKKYDANNSRINRASSPRHKKYDANNPEEKQKWLEHQQQKYERHVNKKSKLRDRRRQKKQQNHNQKEPGDGGDRRDGGDWREERGGRNSNSYSSRNSRNSRNSNNQEEHLSTRQIKGEAATKVQSMFRGMHAREQYEDMLDQADASTLLQAHARGFAVRMEVAEMNVAAIKVQRLYRESATRKRKTRTTRNNRMSIGRYNDEHNNEYNTRPTGTSRRPMNLREKKGRAAIKIQALERGRVARADVEMLEDEMDSAIAIQKHMRGKAVRLEIQEQHQSARSIQKHARGQLVRNGFCPDPHYQAPKKLGTPRPGAAIHTGKGQRTSATHKSIKVTKGTKGTKGQSRSSSASAPRSSHGQLHGTKEVNTAAIKVQSLYRGHVAREDVEDMREEADAASLIQAQIRGKGVRLEVMEMNRAAKVIQRHERGNQARDYVEEMREDDESSTMIQKHVRGAAVRMEISELHNAGTLIQKTVRGKQARAKYGKTKSVGRTSIDIEEPKEESQAEAEEEDNETEEEREEVEVVEQEETEEPAATMIRCVAIHDFDSTGEGEEADDLPFDTGTIIIATDTSEDWWCGYRENEGPSGKHGYFPHNYVQVQVAEDR